jgi:DNA modification methylase
MHGGQTVLDSLKNQYHNDNGSHESVIRLYAGGILEAARVLKQGGKIIVKCQDETESGKQRLSHVELIQILTLFGFEILDLFVLVQATTPCLQVKEQKTARKNHSYALIGKYRR